MSNLNVKVIRIDPFKRNAALLVITGRDLTREVRRITKAKQLGHRHLLDIEDRRVMGKRMNAKGGEETFDAGPTKLFAAADAAAEKGQPGWRLKGGDTTVGFSLLFGKGQNSMTDVPVDLAWLSTRLEWVDAATADAEDEQLSWANAFIGKCLAATEFNAFEAMLLEQKHWLDKLATERPDLAEKAAQAIIEARGRLA